MTARAKSRAIVEPVRADETPCAMRSAVEARGIRVDETKMVVITAIPMQPPTWWNTLTSPEAAPASSSGTPVMARLVRVMNAIPAPTPRRSNGSAIPPT
jgi:hypothetical protein